MRAAAGRPASEALRSVIEATRVFSGRDGYDDDFTLVVLDRLAPVEAAQRVALSAEHR